MCLGMSKVLYLARRGDQGSRQTQTRRNDRVTGQALFGCRAGQILADLETRRSKFTFQKSSEPSLFKGQGKPDCCKRPRASEGLDCIWFREKDIYKIVLLEEFKDQNRQATRRSCLFGRWLIRLPCPDLK